MTEQFKGNHRWKQQKNNTGLSLLLYAVFFFKLGTRIQKYRFTRRTTSAIERNSFLTSLSPPLSPAAQAAFFSIVKLYTTYYPTPQLIYQSTNYIWNTGAGLVYLLIYHTEWITPIFQVRSQSTNITLILYF